MDECFRVKYKTVDETKLMIVSAPDLPTAQTRAEEYLEKKYGETFAIDQVSPDDNRPLWFRIADHVFENGAHRHNCGSEMEAEELAEKIYQVFEDRGISDCFDTLRHEKTVHTFPVYWVLPGSIRWKELKKTKEQDLGWYGRNR